jgi:hypothetical protein
MRGSSRVRAHGWSTFWVACAVAFACATLISVVAGARRTASAPDRYTASVGGDLDASIEQRAGRPLTNEIVALPAVKELSAYTFVFGGLDSAQHRVPQNLLTFAGTRPLSSRLVTGRDPNATAPHEFEADATFAKTAHARIGDRFRFVSISRAQAESGEGFNVKPRGATFDAVLVGIIDSPDGLDSDLTVAVFSPALLDQDVGTVATEYQVRLVPGSARAQLRRELDALPDAGTLSVDGGEVISSDIRSAVDAQATGVWLMAGVLSIAALVALGQLLTRHVQLSDRDRTPLVAIGFTRRQRVIEGVLVAAVPTLVGVAVGALLAIAPSGVFPTGFARALEPHAGISVDFVAVSTTAGALLLATLGWVAVALVYDERRRARAPSRRGRVFLSRMPSTAASIGARFALTRGNRRRPAYGTIAALASIVALVIAASTFAASLDRLVADHGRFGQNYDFAVGDDGSNHSPAQLRAAYANDADVGGMMILSEGSARVTSSTANLDIVGVDRVKGTLAPRLLAGRLPIAPDEIALGQVSARGLGRHVGDTFQLTGVHGPATYRVVGLAIVPGVGGNDGVGLGGVVTLAGFRRVQSDASANAAAISLRADAGPGAERRIAHRIGTQAGPEDTPSAVANVGRVRGVPSVLAVLLGLLVLTTMLHALVVSIRSRRVDLAILKGLGANRRWIGRVVHSQATLLVVVPLLIGLPIGLLLGSRVFRAFVGRIGAWPDAVIPGLAMVAIALGLLLLANVAALVPARRARRLPTATMLRAE